VHRTRDGGLLEPPSPEEIARSFGKHASAVPAAKDLAVNENKGLQPEQALPGAGSGADGVKKNK